MTTSMTRHEAELHGDRLNIMFFGKPADDATELDVLEKAYSEEEMPPKLRARFELLKEEKCVEDFVERHRFRALTSELRRRYFGEQPDFTHWSALDYWTAHEAALLTMELNPRADLLSEIQNVDSTLATSDPSLRAQRTREALKQSRLMEKGIEAMGSIPAPIVGRYLDSAAVLREYALADAASEYVRLQDRVRRLVDAGNLPGRITPAEFLTWARANSIPMPEELTRAIEARNKIPDPMALLEENEALKREVDQLRAIQETNAERDVLNPRGRKSTLLIIASMAIKLGFHPGKRNEVSKLIESDLLLKGIDLTDETIHNRLKEACSYRERLSRDKT